MFILPSFFLIIIIFPFLHFVAFYLVFAVMAQFLHMHHYSVILCCNLCREECEYQKVWISWIGTAIPVSLKFKHCQCLFENVELNWVPAGVVYILSSSITIIANEFFSYFLQLLCAGVFICILQIVLLFSFSLLFIESAIRWHSGELMVV